VRRVPALALLCLSATLVAAAPPKATPAPKVTPTPTPKATATATPQAVHLPLIVVYPFEGSSDIKPDVGQRAAQLFVQQMNAAGGIDTISAPATVKHSDYLSYAKSVNADYYVSGYMTPLGEGVSLVEQVVSTQSGTITYGATAQIASFEDATSQAIMIHDAIQARERSFAEAYKNATAESTSTPAPKQNQADLKRGFSDIVGLFHRGGKATPTPAAGAVKPPKGIYVVHVNGHLPQTDLNKATSELYAALNSHYIVHMSNAPGSNLKSEADGICGTDRNNTIASGTIAAESSRHGLGSRTEYTFVLSVYTCWGAKLAEHTGKAGSLSSAVAQAVAAFTEASPQNA
jgi:hypothetical protein